MATLSVPHIDRERSLDEAQRNRGASFALLHGQLANPDYASPHPGYRLRSRNTIESLGIWEQLYDPDHKPVEFDRFSDSGENRPAFIEQLKRQAAKTPNECAYFNVP